MSFRIVVDERERNSKVPKFLTENGAKVDFARLTVGDYILSQDIVVERKTISDLISSIYDGRLFVQCSDLLNFYSKPILLIEGNIMDLINDPDSGTITDQLEISIDKTLQIYDAIATVAIIFRIPIIHSPSSQHTSKFLITLIKKAFKSGLVINGPLIKRIRKGNQIQLQQLLVLSSLPGVGDKLAIRLLQKFKTPLRAINASISELSMVPGFGTVRAEKIRKVLNHEFEDKRTNNQQTELNF